MAFKCLQTGLAAQIQMHNSTSNSLTERSRVRIQDVLELHTGEFYGQLVDSNFSSFKAQIKAK